VFNADGLRIAYQMPDGIYLIDTLGGEPSLVLADYAEPQFAGDNLLVRIPDGDLALFAIETGEVQRLGSFVRAKPLPDGRILGAGAPASNMESGIYLMGVGSPPVMLYRTPAGLRIRD